MISPTVDSVADALRDQVIQWRRHLHQHPELSFEEHETARFVEQTLQTFGGLNISRPTPTSVVARLETGRPGPVLALRADMDALPIQEENTHEFVSTAPGVMHACGHDGHTAVLLGVARVLTERRAELAGELRFIFQHAEEVLPGGAQAMVDAGVMDGVDMIVGQHVWATLEHGQIGVKEGPMMASPDTFFITIRGKGGHAAYDSVGKDTLMGSLACLGVRGHLVNFGQSSGPVAPFAVSALSDKSNSLTRPMLFHYMTDRKELEALAQSLFDVLAAGSVDAGAPQLFALAEASAAHAALEARRTAGSVVLIA